MKKSESFNVENKNYMQPAFDLLKNKKYQSLINYVNDIINIQINIPDDTVANLYSIKGKSFYYLKKYGNALESFNLSLHYNANKVDTLYYKGKTLYKMEQYDKSLLFFDIGLTLESNHYEINHYKSIIHSKLNDHKSALYYINKTIDLNPENPIAYNDKGLILIKAGKKYDAIKFYSDTIKKFIISNPEVALKHSESLTKIAFDNPNILFNRIKELIDVGHYSKALDNLKQIKINNDEISENLSNKINLCKLGEKTKFSTFVEFQDLLSNYTNSEIMENIISYMNPEEEKLDLIGMIPGGINE